MIGSILITFALVTGITSTVLYFLNYRGNNKTLHTARITYYAMTVFVISASALFLQAILSHQYQYKYIFNNSGSKLPLGLLISTFYAGQEGSFLLWTLFAVIVGIILQQYVSKRGDLEPRVMFVFNLSSVFLLIMISPVLKNPFAYIGNEDIYISIKQINQSLLSLPFIQNFLFTDNANNQLFIKLCPQLTSLLAASNIAIKDFIIQGNGLNPLLQNFWMQIHPPILFAGFALSAVPFSFAAAAMLKNDYKELIDNVLPWILSLTMILGLAIMLGGYWAYGVLGWGGFWGWDPVENSSLIPWLVSAASIHTLILQKKSLIEDTSNGVGQFVKTNISLCVLIYVLVIYSTFLTRSGILGNVSVHSFTDPGRSVYIFLIIFILVFTALGFGLLYYRWKTLSVKIEPYKHFLSRELAMFTGAVAILASAFLIFTGTSLPIFGTSVTTQFYSKLNLPIAIIIGLLGGFSILLRWEHNHWKDLMKRSFFSVTASFIVALLVNILGNIQNATIIILTLTSSFMFFMNVEVSFKTIIKNHGKPGASITHIGIAVFLLGIAGTSCFSEKVPIQLTRGEKKAAFDYDLTFISYESYNKGQKYKFNIEVKDDNSISIAVPVMSLSDYNNSLMREPAIVKKATEDLYIEPVYYDDGSEQNRIPVTLRKGNSTRFGNSIITFDGFSLPKDVMKDMITGNDFNASAKLKVENNSGLKNVEVSMKNIRGEKHFTPVKIPEADLKIEMTNLDAKGEIDLVLSRLTTIKAANKATLSIEVSVKPFINFIWLGVIITVIGLFISLLPQSKGNKPALPQG